VGGSANDADVDAATHVQQTGSPRARIPPRLCAVWRSPADGPASSQRLQAVATGTGPILSAGQSRYQNGSVEPAGGKRRRRSHLLNVEAQFLQTRLESIFSSMRRDVFTSEEIEARLPRLGTVLTSSRRSGAARGCLVLPLTRTGSSSAGMSNGFRMTQAVNFSKALSTCDSSSVSSAYIP
jgi:hypothetical protein